MSDALTVTAVVVLYLLACLDYRREQLAARAACRCGCGQSARHPNLPRSDA